MKKQNHRRVGARYEESAVGFLEKQGYVILERNYRCPMGEIDIVAEEQEYLCFVEVKYRSQIQYGGPLYAVDRKKQRRISLAALHYLKGHAKTLYRPVRFDVVGILPEETILIKNAFSYWQG
ncbi:MAG: YraN family protein [Lachnospiraceae bacterium]|jgi:putative endonuclease